MQGMMRGDGSDTDKKVCKYVVKSSKFMKRHAISSVSWSGGRALMRTIYVS